MTISETIPLSRDRDWTSEQQAVSGRRGQTQRVQRLGVAFSGGVDSSLLLALAAGSGVQRAVALLGSRRVWRLRSGRRRMMSRASWA